MDDNKESEIDLLERRLRILLTGTEYPDKLRPVFEATRRAALAQHLAAGSEVELIEAIKRAWQTVRNGPELRNDSEMAHAALDAVLGRITAGLALAPREEWRPIESAPRDGTVILTAQAGDHAATFTGWWQNDAWWTGWVSGGSRSDVEAISPTHWRPLPAPPATEGSVMPESKLPAMLRQRWADALAEHAAAKIEELERALAAKDAEIERSKRQAREVTAALEIASQIDAPSRCQVFIRAFVEEKYWAVADVSKRLAALQKDHPDAG